MAAFPEASELLRSLGERLRAARLARNDTMLVFAERLGVSESTVRDMERGLPTVAVGSWINAFASLDRLEELEGALKPRESLLARARGAPHRKRARIRRARP